MTSVQDTIDAGPDVAMPEEPEPLDHRYRRWRYGNPWVLGEVARTTRELWEATGRKPTIAQVWEELRGRVHTNGHPYRWNNSYRALAARDVMALYPDLDGVFRLRERRA